MISEQYAWIASRLLLSVEEDRLLSPKVTLDVYFNPNPKIVEMVIGHHNEIKFNILGFKFEINSRISYLIFSNRITL